MHSNIFQVSTSPINEWEYVSEDDYYNIWFTREIADYVSDDCNREDAIKWFTKCVNGCVVDEDNDGYYIIINSKEEYFANAFRKFKVALERIGMPTIEDFINGIDLWDLKDAQEDRFGFYVDYFGSELMTFDKFVRQSEVGKKYYIGGILDYHY